MDQRKRLYEEVSMESDGCSKPGSFLDPRIDKIDEKVVRIVAIPLSVAPKVIAQNYI